MVRYTVRRSNTLLAMLAFQGRAFVVACINMLPDLVVVHDCWEYALLEHERTDDLVELMLSLHCFPNIFLNDRPWN